MGDNERSAEGRVLRVGKKDRPNWFMLAGGAVVMAISVALGRRKILREEEMVKKKVSIAGAGISVAPHEDDETGSVPTYGTDLNKTLCWDKSEAASQVELMHRLIESRDATITKFKSSQHIVKFDQDIAALSGAIHLPILEEIIKILEANLEVKRLHRQLNSLRIKRTADVDEECIDIAVAEKKQDVEKLVLEARKSLETVECLEREKEVRVKLIQAKSRQCELLYKKVSILTMELEEVKTAAQEKQQLLETKEEENFKLASLLEELQHKVEHRSDEWARSSKLSKKTNTKNKQSSWKRNYDVNHGTPNYKELFSTCKQVVGGNQTNV